MRVLVTGATGLVGRHLIHSLQLEGHDVLALARSPDGLPELPAEKIFKWSDSEVPSREALEGVDVIVHLAGENVAGKRWTQERKRALRRSRVDGSANLLRAIAAVPPEKRPKTLIAASAVGFYGSSLEAVDESAPSGSDFLGRLCKDWEAAASESENLGLRLVTMRIGLVLSNQGGFLSKSGPFIFGSGRQWMSWIHIDDLIGFIKLAAQSDQVRGSYNLTAPEPVTNGEFARIYGRTLGFPFVVRIPAVLPRLVLGEMADAVLASQRVLPKRTLSSGFQFRFATLEPALADLFETRSFLDNRFSARQFVPVSCDEVFPFFSKAENLETLTPPWLNFRIEKKSTPEISEGSIIDYRLRIHGLPVRWRTLISRWSPKSLFVDEQIRGPYKKWHHVHRFDPVPGGTLISDDVTFRVPGSLPGKIFLLPFIEKDVRTIFRYRQGKIRRLCAEGSLR